MLLRIGHTFGRCSQYVFELLKFDVPFFCTIEPDTSVADKCAVFEFEQDLHAHVSKNCEMLSQMKEMLVSDVSLAACNTLSVYLLYFSCNM